VLSFHAAPTRFFGVKSLVILGGFDDSLQVFGTFGPSEWIAGLVIVGEETVQQLLEILLGMLDAVCQTLLAEEAEETFDQV
jgi:hypothetical protein